MLIGYARVSTTDQKLVLQVDALEQAGCEKVFVEKASGAARDRPQLKAALEYARRGDVLVVWKLDRLARSLSLILDTLKDLEARGIEIRCLQQQIDTWTSWGKAFFQIMCVIAEVERNLNHERTLAGLAAARARGRVGGRPRKMGEAQVIAAKALLKRGDRTVVEVAHELKVAVATLYKHLPAARYTVANEDRHESQSLATEA
ncbi:recombinase family protein [uncultured Hyphomicrobium sp.]|uniref:recombinase family protein n=1 Tax=uncultured Hyphomicrobium sp. TaxID=194373 RepID=UPI0025E51BD5|nr:recombinase family protein [uncultured Hyphomicrobium sp.]